MTNRISVLERLIPDVDVLLALEPEELGWFLLKGAREKIQNGMFWPDSLSEKIVGSGLAATAEFCYPHHRQHEVDVALGEAWNWLRVHSLVIPASGTNGQNGWLMFSRRGAKIGNEKDFQCFKEAVAFPRSLLHPLIADKVWLALARGDLDEAVFSAFKTVEVQVRTAAHLEPTDIGTDLMRKAFHAETGALTDKSQPKAEREALAHLFAGAIGSYKNPHSHRTVSITEMREAQEMVLLATHLLRIIDVRRELFPQYGKHESSCNQHHQ